METKKIASFVKNTITTECYLPVLTDFFGLFEIAKQLNLVTNLENVKKECCEMRRRPQMETSWFYYTCGKKCESDCSGRVIIISYNLELHLLLVVLFIM